MANTISSSKLNGLTQALLFCAISVASSSISFAESATEHSSSEMSLQQASTQTKATQIVDNIYSATGFGNTFLVVTDEGNVVIDSSLASNAPKHKELLNKVDSREPQYIIITHY